MPRPAPLIIEAGRTERHYWQDLWRFRELFYILAWRDILVRYKQTTIGIAWAIVRPLLTMLVFTVVFGRIAKLPSDGIPYPVLVLAGLLPWQFFAASVTEAGNSLIGNASMISKVYFPRLTIPASAVIVGFIDLLVAGLLAVPILAWYGIVPDARIVTLPLFVAMAFAASMGAGLWIAALNVKFRDFRYIVPFALQLGLYVSPVGFSSAIVPQAWRLAYYANPMAGAIDGFRWSLLGGRAPLYGPGMALSLAVVLVLLVSGIHYFRKTERHFADLI